MSINDEIFEQLKGIRQDQKEYAVENKEDHGQLFKKIDGVKETQGMQNTRLALVEKEINDNMERRNQNRGGYINFLASIIGGAILVALGWIVGKVK